MSAAVKCKYCPAMIRWAVTVKGRMIPLDPDPLKVFVRVSAPERSDREEPKVRLVSGYTTHYATCPAAAKARADAAERRSQGGEAFANSRAGRAGD